MDANGTTNVNENGTSGTNIDYSHIYKRKLRSLTERILLIRVELLYSVNYKDGIEFTMLGSSNKIYNVEICRDLDLHYSCNCPDYKYRETVCKHIYFIGTKFFNTMDPQNWNLLDYTHILNKYWINNNCTGRNEDCPICLEQINYQTESTICCTYQCYNSVHTICWGRYNNISRSIKCIFCRANSMPNY